MSLKWVIGNALSVAADMTRQETAEAIYDLARDPAHGHARQMLCEALRRWGDERAIALLRAIGARDAVARFVESRNTMLRNEAKRGLKKIDSRRR